MEFERADQLTEYVMGRLKDGASTKQIEAEVGDVPQPILQQAAIASLKSIIEHQDRQRKARAEFQKLLDSVFDAPEGS